MSDTSSVSKKGVRSCPSCHARLSSRDMDPHVLCIRCRGVDCDMNTRCDVCGEWDASMMSMYLSHRMSSETDSGSKARRKEQISDFTSTCTGGPGNVGELSGVDGPRAEVVLDSASSIPASAVAYDVDRRVEVKFDALKESLNTDL